MKRFLLVLPLALAACVQPDCVVMVNGQPVYGQCYDENHDGGNNRVAVNTPDDGDDNGGDNGDHSNGGHSDDNGDRSNGGHSRGDSNGGNSDD